MITAEELKEIARLSHFKPHQQEKHYIQTIILNSIYSTTSDELIFKGGTCLMFVYGINRFSENLDFTMAKSIDINKLMDNIKKDLDNLGIPYKMSKLKEDNISLSFKIGIEGPLFHKEIERCFVSLDISKRENVENKKVVELKSPYKEILGFSINVISEEEILAEKIRALVTRNQARDLFDLYFLLKKGIRINIGLINKKLCYYKKEFDKKEIIQAIKNKEDIWHSELSSLIIGNLPDFREVSKYSIRALGEEAKNKAGYSERYKSFPKLREFIIL